VLAVYCGVLQYFSVLSLNTANHRELVIHKLQLL